MPNIHGHRSRFTVSLVLFVVMGTFSLFLTGCSASASSQLVFIVGAHQNAPLVTPALITPYLSSLHQNGDRITVIVSDGTPKAIYDKTLDSLPENGDDLTAYLDTLASTVTERVSAAEAASPEVDMTEAIAVAAKAFSATPGSKTLVILDPMLQTTGGLSMLDGHLYDSAADRVTALKNAGGVVDLAGQIDVIVPRLGLTEAPQQPLTLDAMTSLQTTWQEFFNQAHARGVDFTTVSLTEVPQTAAELPTVTPVPITRPAAPASTECSQKLPDNSIGFRGNEATFIDPAAAAATIAAAAAALAGCTGDITVGGSTSAVDGQDINVPLSTARANAVAVPLATALNIPLSSIKIIGWGDTWPCRQADHDANGDIIPTAAQANRTVIISQGASSTACP